MNLLYLQFNDTVNLGAGIMGILLALAALAVFFYGLRWKSNFDTAMATVETLKESRDAYEKELTRIRLEATEQRELKHEALSELAAERMKTDLTGLMTEFQRQHLELLGELRAGREVEMNAVSAQLQRHEDRAIERHEEVVASLQAIVKQLARRQQ